MQTPVGYIEVLGLLLLCFIYIKFNQLFIFQACFYLCSLFHRHAVPQATASVYRENMKQLLNSLTEPCR